MVLPVIGLGVGTAAAAPTDFEPQLVAERHTDRSVVSPLAGSVTDYHYDPVTGNYMGWTKITTWSDTRRKKLEVCDERADGKSPAILIDPLGAGPPDTLLYFDPNGSTPGCLDHTIGYDVRKWALATEQGGVNIRPVVWELFPFPPCPPCTPQ